MKRTKVTPIGSEQWTKIEIKKMKRKAKNKKMRK